MYSVYEKGDDNEKRQALHDSPALMNYDTKELIGNITEEELDSIDIVYYDSPLENKASYLQPCYRFSGTVTDDQSNTSAFTVLIPALSDEDTKD